LLRGGPGDVKAEVKMKRGSLQISAAFSSGPVCPLETHRCCCSSCTVPGSPTPHSQPVHHRSLRHTEVSPLCCMRNISPGPAVERTDT
ncbi:hypothetical protein GOODEAATRI_029596, partial [Goodea atripinnis]